MSIGSRIREAREEKGVTLEQLGSACGTTKQTIYKYENGIITNIPMDKIESIARFLNVSPAYILGWDNFSGEDGIEPDVAILSDMNDASVMRNQSSHNQSHAGSIPRSIFHDKRRDQVVTELRKLGFKVKKSGYHIVVTNLRSELEHRLDQYAFELDCTDDCLKESALKKARQISYAIQVEEENSISAMYFSLSERDKGLVDKIFEGHRRGECPMIIY